MLVCTFNRSLIWWGPVTVWICAGWIHYAGTQFRISYLYYLPHWILIDIKVQRCQNTSNYQSPDLNNLMEVVNKPYLDCCLVALYCKAHLCLNKELRHERVPVAPTTKGSQLRYHWPPGARTLQAKRNPPPLLCSVYHPLQFPCWYQKSREFPRCLSCTFT